MLHIKKPLLSGRQNQDIHDLRDYAQLSKCPLKASTVNQACEVPAIPLAVT